MTELHPHWHATPDEEPVRVTVAAKEKIPTRVPVAAASRLPAAFAGIAVFAMVGLTASGGWQALRAQVTGTQAQASSSSSSPTTDALDPVRIRITPAGFLPAEATVRPGQTIIWVNEQTIPHILTSQTLRNASGTYLNTAAIFPQSEVSFVVGAREINRTHNYGSTTDISLKGKIVVQKPTGNPGATASTNASGSPFGSLDDVPLPTGGMGTSVASVPATAVRPSAPSAPPAPIPVPTPTASVTPTALPTVTNTPIQDVAPVTPEVTVQPETGPEVWVVIFLSIAGLYAATRSSFRRIQL